MSDLTLIIQAKNEKESLPKVLDELNKFDFRKNIILEASDKLTIEAVKTYDCKIYEAKWMLNENSLVFKIKANRFLRNMVRAIVGTLIEIGLGKITEEEFKLIIEKKNRQLAGFSVPAHALFLNNIDYDWDKILLNG